MSKSYSNTRISVQFDAKRCIHSEHCVHGLSTVFDVNKKPWINVDGATTEQIMRQIDNCPSGALSYQLTANKEQQTMSSNHDAAVTLQVTPKGPYLIKGKLHMTDDKGQTVEKDGSIALCRCGASKNKPYCDGSHKTVGDIW